MIKKSGIFFRTAGKHPEQGLEKYFQLCTGAFSVIASMWQKNNEFGQIGEFAWFLVIPITLSIVFPVEKT